jgi:hypothetical protein
MFHPCFSFSRSVSHLGDTLARRLLKSVPMAEDLDREFQLLDKAVFARDPLVHARWISEYCAWVNGDHLGACPFETEDAYKRTSMA